jgi:hypothetical protein
MLLRPEVSSNLQECTFVMVNKLVPYENGLAGPAEVGERLARSGGLSE